MTLLTTTFEVEENPPKRSFGGALGLRLCPDENIASRWPVSEDKMLGQRQNFLHVRCVNAVDVNDGNLHDMIGIDTEKARANKRSPLLPQLLDMTKGWLRKKARIRSRRRRRGHIPF